MRSSGLRLGGVSKNPQIDIWRMYDDRKHLLRSWSSTQPSIAMSSAEADYYALVEGATRSLGLQSMMRELGLRKNIVVQTDSSAAKSFASQMGVRANATHRGQISMVARSNLSQ